VRLILRLVRLCLVEHGLERPRIDLEQGIAFLDFLAFPKIDLHDLAVYSGLHRHGLESLHVTQPANEYRNVPGFGDRHRYWNGRTGRARGLPAPCRARSAGRRSNRHKPPGAQPAQ
jgi:hypothetical protein